jgi:hypothetical protein
VALSRIIAAVVAGIAGVAVAHSTAASSQATVTPAQPARVAAVTRPPIRDNFVQFGQRRRAETVAYVRRHYGSFMRPTYKLVNPHVIVIHYTDASLSSTLNTFADDVPDSELHELPGTCAHYVIDSAGVIHEEVPPSIICRHTVGLNWTAIGVEHVGFSDGQVLGDPRQISASLHLVQWLRCKFRIPVQDVIGHNESLSSPYHREDVAALRTQTHDDFKRSDMNIYRSRLRKLGKCPAA